MDKKEEWIKYKSSDFYQEVSKKKDIDPIDNKKFFNSIGENINVYTLQFPNSTIEIKKIQIFKLLLKSEKEHNYRFIIKFFLKLFPKNTPLIFIIKYKKEYSFIIKMDILIEKNPKLKTIINRNYYATKFLSKDLYEVLFFKLQNVDNMSLLDKFDELCRQIIYVDKTLEKDQVYVSWELINLIVDKFMILSKINKTRRKMNNHSNQSIKFDLHKQIEELKQNLKSIDEKISNYKIDKIGNNEN